MKITSKNLQTLRRRLHFLQARPYDNTFDKAEIVALTNVLQVAEQDVEPGRRVVCAALQLAPNDLILGARHYDGLMQMQIELDTVDWSKADQGFIDNHGSYLTREQAWNIAEEAGQIIRRVCGDGQKLFSENLY